MALPSPRDPEVLRKDLGAWISEHVGADVIVGEPSGPPATGFSNETILVDAQWDDGDGARPHRLVRLTELLKDVELFPQDSDFARTNMGCAALEGALRAMDVDPDADGA